MDYIINLVIIMPRLKGDTAKTRRIAMVHVWLAIAPITMG